MKKFSLLLCCFVALLVSQKVWADDFSRTVGVLTVSVSGTTLTVTNGSGGSAGALNTFMNSQATSDEGTAMKACTKIVLIGKFNASDFSSINYESGFNNVTEVDMKDALTYTAVNSSPTSYTWFNTEASGTANAGDVAFVGGALWQVSTSKVWTRIYDSNHEFTEYDSEAEMNSQTDGAIGSYAKCPLYKYCQMSVPSNEAWTLLDSEDNHSGAISVAWLENVKDDHKYKFEDNQIVEVKRFYKLESSGWTTDVVYPTSADLAAVREGGIHDGNMVGAIEGALVTNEYTQTGDYIFFRHYYKKVGTRTWTGDKDTEEAGAESASFLYDDRNNTANKNYSDGQWVKMPTGEYFYYQLQQENSPTRTWTNVTSNYTEKSGVNYHFAEGTTMSNETESSSIDGQFAIVGGTEWVYDGTQWATGLTHVFNYGEIKFTYWQQTVTTVILPDNLTASDCSWGFLDGCTSLSNVKSGGITATITSGNVANITTTDDDEFARVKDILTWRCSMTVNRVRKVLDLRSQPIVDITVPYLDGLTDSDLEYILLPKGMSKEVVCNADYSDLTGLKAVISSYMRSDDVNPRSLVAYVKVPGSLAEARYLVSDGAGSIIEPTCQHLTSVTLAGNLYNDDINTANEKALKDERSYITKIDLEKAVFINPSTGFIDSEQMSFSNALFRGNTNECPLSDITLPTNREMTTITSNCFLNLQSLTSICIPYNYTHIYTGAFIGTNLSHITTTDGFDGAIIDNGVYTYTFSANLKQLGTAPSGGPLFPANQGVKDVYSLATLVPKCYSGTFPTNLTHGCGGIDPDMVYCREKYHNINSSSEIIGLLHFPSKESFENAASNLKEPTGVDASLNNNNVTDGYTKMVMKYTDPYREFTKKDQTGAIDGNGKPLLWPTRTEVYEAYTMAGEGMVWSDYTYNHTGTNLEEIEKSLKPINSLEHYDFDEYVGWHEIVLSRATYMDKPEEVKEGGIIERKYVTGDWYTFCIPYNLTYSQVVRMLGIPESYRDENGNNVENYELTEEGYKKVTVDKMPQIRQLEKVVRTVSSPKNTIEYRLTTNLADPGNKTAKYLYFIEEDGLDSDYKFVSARQQFNGSGEPIFDGENPVLDDAEDPICLVGGRPYMIMPYKREGETISKNNLGMYIMTHYAHEFSHEASCVYDGPDFCEQFKSYAYNEDGESVKSEGTINDNVAMRFAKPFEKHKVQALDGAKNGDKLTYKDGDNSYRYYYTMIGQFWQQDLPEYCIYMSGQTWYRYTGVTNSAGNKYQWAPYKCVILASPEIYADKITTADVPEGDELMPIADIKRYSGGGFRSVKNCYFPMNKFGSNDLIPAPLRLWFSGRDDFSFTNQGHVSDASSSVSGESSGTRIIFTMDDQEIIVDNGEDATAVKTIDMLDGVPQFNSDARVYSISGQYMGNSTEGLPKGIYIVGGRKIVVD